MTENEAIKTLLGKIMPLNIHNSPFIHKGNQAHEMAIQALKEIQQYRAYKEIFESHFSQDALELLSDEVEFGKWLERGKWIAKRCDEINRELEEYRAIGTAEEIQKKMEELERWHTDRINENIKNSFAYTSTMICHNCDHKDEYIEELEAENAEYKSIGTIEEFKTLKDKSEPKKSIIHGLGQRYCPVCKSGGADHFYCARCGQKLG